MRSYLLIESRCHQESPDVAALFELGTRLRAAGHEVGVFLVQNAVLALGAADTLTDMINSGVQVWADGHAILARGLDPARRPDGVLLGGADELVELLMADDVTPVWH
jgi:predicted peroxiredoxin